MTSRKSKPVVAVKTMVEVRLDRDGPPVDFASFDAAMIELGLVWNEYGKFERIGAAVEKALTARPVERAPEAGSLGWLDNEARVRLQQVRDAIRERDSEFAAVTAYELGWACAMADQRRWLIAVGRARVGTKGPGGRPSLKPDLEWAERVKGLRGNARDNEVADLRKSKPESIKRSTRRLRRQK